MPAQRKIILTGEEDRTLRELRQAQTVPQRVRERAHMLRLNAQGYSTAEIATIFECHPHTVRTTVTRWEYRGIGGLWETKGRGAKPKWTAADLEYIEQCLELEERTYNGLQLDLSENLYCSIGMAFSQYLIDDVLRMFQQR